MIKNTSSRPNAVIIGRQDSGKSTLFDRLAWEAHRWFLSEKPSEGKDKLTSDEFLFKPIQVNYKISRKAPDNSISRYEKFSYESNSYVIIDTPGHRDFIKNTISGISQADAAVIVISAIPDEFELNIPKKGQLYEDALIAHALGINQFIICVSKMDDKKVSYSEDRFNEIVKIIIENLEVIGIDIKKVQFLPVSGMLGDNLFKKSENLKWFKGPTLIEALDNLSIIGSDSLQKKPLRIIVNAVHKIGGIGIVAVGKVEAGELKRGKNIMISPQGLVKESKTIENFKESVEFGITGMQIGINIKGLSLKEIKKGSIIGDEVDNPPKSAHSFIAHIVIHNHPGEIKEGYSPIISCHSAHVSCRFDELKCKIDKKTGEVIEHAPKFLKAGDAAVVKLKPLYPLCVENYDEYPRLGKFVVRDLKIIVATGTVMSVTKNK